ncbi:MAG TPA: hypothetical protein VHH73_10965 [Verrucomicrobiae bacterium]|nr:hypothetical protein [Verrucomicrobiae bacterium]
MLFLALNARAAEPPAKPLFKDFMGINGHTVQFKPKLYQPVASLVRDYHPVEWDLGKDSDFQTPFPQARNGVDWNQVYGSWRNEGWRVNASLMFESLKRDQWKDLTADSRAYGERIARALGPSSAKPLLEAVEIGNEPGKYSDADYRVIFENMARGLKAGDPRLRVATCNLTTGKSHDYAKSVTCIAGLESLCDVLNIHSYAQLEGWPTWRRSFPEDPGLKEYLPDILRLCEWRDARAPGKEVWLTEFGYDATTRAPDPKAEFKQWVGVTEEQQAQWTVRSWLVFATLPIQRAYYYFFNDDDTPHVHGSSGLTRNFQPKPVFYAAAHLQSALGEYRFARALVDRPGEACLYEFTHGTDVTRRVWVAWSPTGKGRFVTLDLPDTGGAKIERAERMALHPGNPSVVDVKPNARQITIGESPVYLFLKTK